MPFGPPGRITPVVYYAIGHNAPTTPKVVLMGDSYTANYYTQAATFLNPRPYTTAPIGGVGVGILDETLSGGQWASSTLALNPDIVIFQAIGNYGIFTATPPVQTWGSPGFFSEWYTELGLQVSILTQSATGVKAGLVLCPDSNSADPVRNAVTPVIRAQNATIAANNPSTTFTVDVHKAFGGQYNGTYMLADGIHPNALGNTVICELINRAVVGGGISV